MKSVYLAAALFTLFSSSACAAVTADRLFINANIYGHAAADTLAVHAGNIIFIGQHSAVAAYQNETTEVIDLDQAYLLPGFIDNHNHLFEAASEAGGHCELTMEASLEEQIPALTSCRGKREGWLLGYGFAIDAVLDPENERTPLEVLDQVFPMQPVVLMEQSSHSVWVNSAALKEVGITRESVDPPGGKILRDDHSGALNGILLDNAGDLVLEIAWNRLEKPFEQSYAGLMMGLDEVAAQGITTVGDGRMYWQRGWYEVWRQADKAGELSARVSLRPWIYPAEAMAPQLEYLKTIQSSEPSERLLVDQAKLYSDGIIINGTAKLLTPYLESYLPDQPWGINYIAPEQMGSWLRALDQIGYSAHIHAIGDGAVRESLNAVEQMRQQGSTRPYTLTHLELVSPKDLSRFKLLDVSADFQVGSDYVAEHDHRWADPLLGKKRAKTMMNLNAIYKTGANLTLSSDWNVHELSPLVGIANSLKMGRTGLPDIHAAIAAYTRNAAYSLGLEKVTGSLKRGYSADLVVLDRDITQLTIDAIPTAQVLMTVLQGEIVYDRAQ